MIGKGQRIGWRDNKSERSQEALWSLIVTSFLGSKLASDAIYRFSLLLVLVHTVTGFSSMTLVFPLSAKTINSKSYFDYFPTLYHSHSSVIVSEYKALGNSAYLIIYRTESLHVHSCFRCTSLEKDETLLSTDFASESPKARWDVLKNNKSALFSLSCVMIKAVYFASLRSHPPHTSI